MKRLIAAAVATTGLVLVAPAVSHAADCAVTSYRTQTGSGQRHDDVRCLQQALNEHGVDSGPVDGWFGPVTAAAVVAFQAANGLTVDGEVGAETAGALGVWDASSRPAAAASSSGSRGASGVNWDNVARCESGGDWNAGLRTNHVGTFSGGLMIMQSAWRQYGGGEFAPHAGAATREQQIIVAERIAARVGAARAWECPV